MSSTKLEASVGELDVQVPTIFGDVVNHTLTADYAMPVNRKTKGFYFKSAVGGSYTVVTLAAFYRNGGDVYRDQAMSTAQRDVVIAAAVAAGDTTSLLVGDYQWCDVPLAHLESSGAPTAGTVNIGLY